MAVLERKLRDKDRKHSLVADLSIFPDSNFHIPCVYAL